MPVECIVKSNKSYPEWIKNHEVFQKYSKIDKIFPKIGLPNFREEAKDLTSDNARQFARYLVDSINATCQNSIIYYYQALLDRTILAGEDTPEKTKICAALQANINLCKTLRDLLTRYPNDFITTEDGGRVVLKLRNDIYNGGKRAELKKGESLFSIYNKLIANIDGVAKQPFPLLENLGYFREFSQANTPNKGLNVVFSSTDDEGFWDIATISMRGVASCQTWTAPQSRGLIGSISSKYVGVIYVESPKDQIGIYGSKMIGRSLVRFCIHSRTGKPALLLDTVYPAATNNMVEVFKKVLKNKSGLEVLAVRNDANDGNKRAEYYLPEEDSRQYLKQGESSYMDSPLEFRKHKQVAPFVVNKNISSKVCNFEKSIQEKLNTLVKSRTDAYITHKKQYTAAMEKYNTEKILLLTMGKSEEEVNNTLPKPILEQEINEFGKGGVINLFNHCTKNYANTSATNLFLKEIFNSITIDNKELIASSDEYYKKYLMSFLKNKSKIKEKSFESVKRGTWNTSFPKSTERFYQMVFDQTKNYLLTACKELIKPPVKEEKAA